MWHYVGHSLCWCVWVPVRESLCLLWREPKQRAWAPTRPEVDEGRKVPEKTERDLVDKGKQKEAVRRWKQGREDKRREVRKTTAKTCWHTEAGLTNARRQVSIASGLVRVHARVSSQKAENVSKTSLYLALGANPGPCLFVCSFLPLSRLCFAYL